MSGKWVWTRSLLIGHCSVPADMRPRRDSGRETKITETCKRQRQNLNFYSGESAPYRKP